MPLDEVFCNPWEVVPSGSAGSGLSRFCTQWLAHGVHIQNDGPYAVSPPPHFDIATALYLTPDLAVGYRVRPVHIGDISRAHVRFHINMHLGISLYHVLNGPSYVGGTSNRRGS
jgi:hypothetical protein